MKKQKFHTVAITLIAALLTVPAMMNATIWRVNNNPNYTQGCDHCFSSLQAANDSDIVEAGDTIHLEASHLFYSANGSSSGSLSITVLTKRLVILGPGYFLNQNIGLQKNPTTATTHTITFDSGSEGSVIKGVTVEGNSGSDINIKVSNILVEGCWVERFIDFVASSTYPPISNVIIKKSYIYRVNNSNNAVPIHNLTISNCYIYKDLDLTSSNTPTSGTIAHCVISTDGGPTNNIDIDSGIELYNNIVIRTAPSGSVMLQSNNSVNNVHDNIFISELPSWLSGGNNIALANAVVFPTSGSTDGILNVNPANICPQCYTAYPGNETFGMFGGADPYVLSGIPNIPTIYQLQSPLNAEQGSNVNVNISTRSND